MNEAVEVNTTLSDEEVFLFESLKADIEPVAHQLPDGGMFDVKLAKSNVPPNVVYAIKCHWEAEGWQVGAFNLDVATQLVLVKPKRNSVASFIYPTLERARPEPREVIATTDAQCMPRMSEPLLLRMPTRARPHQAIEVLSAYRRLAKTPIKIEVVVDEDDPFMQDPVVLQRLYDLDCVVTAGRHKNKIDAVNGGRIDDWGILVLASDDMMPVVEGYDEKILTAMEKHFPLLDGAVYFNDGYNRDHRLPDSPILCTLPIIGRYLWEQFGYVYHPEYKSLYCDNEQTDVLTAMNRLVFVDELIIEHRHFAAGKAQFDALYKFNETYSEGDKNLYHTRAARKFDAPQMILSILICSTTSRQKNLKHLVEHLRAQTRQFPREVEIVVSIDDGQVTIGEKRQALLERAVGKYVCFVDDDDMVSFDYVPRIMGALTSQYGVDCTSLIGIITTNGARPETFDHSLKYDKWETIEGRHLRTPNHLNAVRRDLALRAGFVPKNFGEDHAYSNALKPLLKTEASTGDAPLYYYFYRAKKN